NGVPISRPVRLIGIDPKSREQIGSFRKHVIYPDQRDEASFEVAGEALRRYELLNRVWTPPRPIVLPPIDADQPPPPAPTPAAVGPDAGCGRATAGRDPRQPHRQLPRKER